MIVLPLKTDYYDDRKRNRKGVNMSFCWATIHVMDMQKSLSFYQEIAGLKINRRITPGPGMDIVFLGTEDTSTEIELIQNENKQNHSYGIDLTLGFRVDSLEDTIRVLRERNFVDIQGPIQPNPEIRFIYISDPNGVRIQFVEQKM